MPQIDALVNHKEQKTQKNPAIIMAGEQSKTLLVDKMPVLAIKLPLHTTRRYWLWWSDPVKTGPTNCIKNN
jgi:hypothetical protein